MALVSNAWSYTVPHIFTAGQSLRQLRKCGWEERSEVGELLCASVPSFFPHLRLHWLYMNSTQWTLYGFSLRNSDHCFARTLPSLLPAHFPSQVIGRPSLTVAVGCLDPVNLGICVSTERLKQCVLVCPGPGHSRVKLLGQELVRGRHDGQDDILEVTAQFGF